MQRFPTILCSLSKDQCISIWKRQLGRISTGECISSCLDLLWPRSQVEEFPFGHHLIPNPTKRILRKHSQQKAKHHHSKFTWELDRENNPYLNSNSPLTTSQPRMESSLKWESSLQMWKTWRNSTIMMMLIKAKSTKTMLMINSILWISALLSSKKLKCCNKVTNGTVPSVSNTKKPWSKW